MNEHEYTRQAEQILREEIEAMQERVANRISRLVAQKVASDFVAEWIAQHPEWRGGASVQ